MNNEHESVSPSLIGRLMATAARQEIADLTRGLYWDQLSGEGTSPLRGHRS